MTAKNLLRRFLREEAGATIVEFALVSVIFFTLMCGIVEYGLIMFTKVAIESATQQVSRATAIDASVSGCADRVCAIKTLIAQKTAGIVNPANVLITSSVVTNYLDPYPVMPDVCTVGSDPYADPCGPVTVAAPHGTGPYNENNGTPGYQPNSINTGNENDLVQIRVFYTWNVMFPIMRPFFPGGVVPMTSVTVVKNEPFGP